MGGSISPSTGRKRASYWQRFLKMWNNMFCNETRIFSYCNFHLPFQTLPSRKKIEIVTYHRALQWPRNLKSPDGLTVRWLEKLAAFDYEVQHRPSKSIGHADGLSLKLIVNQVTTSENKENLDKPETMNFHELMQKTGNIFETKDSLAHCMSLDFKMPAGTDQISSVSFRTIFQRALILHFSFNKQMIASSTIQLQRHVFFDK